MVSCEAKDKIDLVVKAKKQNSIQLWLHKIKDEVSFHWQICCWQSLANAH